jgi:cation diffusion facilitator CzcD-associated flavoprotein CzcO
MRATDTDVAIIGAGPHGLSAAVKLRRAGVDTTIFGDCMSFWRGMPRGMLLRSNWSASNMVEPAGEHSLMAFQADTGVKFHQPVPLERFVDYGQWVQQRAVPDLDSRRVQRLAQDSGGFRLELEDGDALTARRVVVACGIEPFARRPAEFDELPAELVSHTGEHRDLARFAGRQVGIIGGGQSALESAALLREAGAGVDVFVRRPSVTWLRGAAVIHKLGRLGPIVYAPTDVGPLWYSRLVSVPALFTRLPRRAQNRIARRCIRPAGSHWVRLRLDEVELHLGARIAGAYEHPDGVALRFDGGAERIFDHLLLGTGYQVDVARYPFLDAQLIPRIRRADGYPVLDLGLQSTVPGLHFTGAPACWSAGPIMRFVSGSWHGSDALARALS